MRVITEIVKKGILLPSIYVREPFEMIWTVPALLGPICVLMGAG